MPQATDLAYNVLQLGADGLLVFYASRSEHAARAAVALAAAGISALLLAVWLSTGLFHLTRLLSFAVFAHTPLLLCAVGWTRRRISLRWCAVCWLAALGILVIALDAFLLEPFRLEVSHLRVETGKLARPLRIAVVADLQTDRIDRYEERVLRRVMGADPDLVLMPGDYLHTSDPARYARLAYELRALFERAGFDAPLGIFAVRGNVEHNDWPLIFAGTRVRALDETLSLQVGELQLTGLGLEDSFDTSLHVPASNRFHIVFGHAPDFALGSVDADLLVAGHTHGGQVRIPLWGPVLTFSRVPRAWTAGVARISGGRTLVVSRGIGMERGSAPRLRFRCRPEIVIVDVEPQVADPEPTPMAVDEPGLVI